MKIPLCFKYVINTYLEQLLSVLTTKNELIKGIVSEPIKNNSRGGKPGHMHTWMKS